MILKELIQTFRDLAYTHQEIEGFYTGLTEEHNDSLIQYPALRVVFPYNAISSSDDDVLSFTFDVTLTCNTVEVDTGLSSYELNINFENQDDTLNEIDQELVSENELREKSIRILSQWIQGLRLLEDKHDYFIVQDGWRIDSLERFANDKVTGCRTTLTISVANDYKCQSIANFDGQVWDVNKNLLLDLNYGGTIQMECPPCPPVPSTCQEVIDFIDDNGYRVCVVEDLDFSDEFAPDFTYLTPTQIEQLEDILIPEPQQNSVSLDGVNEYINIPHIAATSFSNTDAFSVSFWFKSTNVALSNRTIFSKRVSTNSPGYSVYITGGDLYVYINNTVSNAILMRTDGVVLNDNTWYHGAFTKTTASNASGITIYINGSPVNTLAGPNALTLSCANTSNQLIGAHFTSGAFFNGNIGNVRIWNKTLSQSDITFDYNGGKMLDTPDTTNLVFGFKGGQDALFSTLFNVPNEVGVKDNNCGVSVNMEYADKTIDIP